MQFISTPALIEVVTNDIPISAADHAALAACITTIERIRTLKTEARESHAPGAKSKIAKALTDGRISVDAALVGMAATGNDRAAVQIAEALSGYETKLLEQAAPACSAIRAARCEIIRERATALENAERAGLAEAGIAEEHFVPSDSVLRLAETRRRELQDVGNIPTSLADLRRLVAMVTPAKSKK
jgi:hypothetical protein